MTPHRTVLVTRRAQRDVTALAATRRVAVLTAITDFARGALNADVRRLQGFDPPRWRLRVGSQRVIFALEPGLIVVERVLDRRDAYR
jgi:mRNA-degrading endonuclease RelE of RelBE toxin-antitoxin system